MAASETGRPLQRSDHAGGCHGQQSVGLHRLRHVGRNLLHAAVGEFGGVFEVGADLEELAEVFIELAEQVVLLHGADEHHLDPDGDGLRPDAGCGKAGLRVVGVFDDAELFAEGPLERRPDMG